MTNFTKPPLTFEEHFTLLSQRGLIIKDEERLLKYLKHIGYYRLTGYMYPFQSSDGTHQFKTNVTFENIINQYIFDKKLRMLILDYIERIEVSMRAQICNTMSMVYGAHWYLDKNLFSDHYFHDQLIANVKEYCSNPNEVFIKNYYSKYNNPECPPAWMMMETFSLGTLSNLFVNLKAPLQRGEIARCYNTVPTILESWMKSLNFIRNCCAHHSRLWNRRIPVKPSLPQKKANKVLIYVNETSNQRLYGIISCMLFMTNAISPSNRFKERLFSLFDAYPDTNIAYMGFENNWKEEPLWM